jgi:hypothetical protein
VKKSSSSHLGKSYHDNSTINISFQKIFEIACFEIENAIFTLDNVLFLQKMGIPIGAIGSPGYRNIYCIFCEFFFMDSIYDYSRAFSYFRFFDDMRAIIAYSPSDLTTKQIGKKLIHYLTKKCYHKSLKIVVEKTPENTFPFLEGQITLTNKAFTSIFKNKNFLPLLETGKLKFITTQDFFSFTGRNNDSLRIGTVTGRLTTLLGYCFSDSDIITSFGHILCHMVALKYPEKIIKKACRKLYFNTSEKIWLLLEKLTAFTFRHVICCA